MKWRIQEKDINGKKYYIPQFRRFWSPFWHNLRLDILLDIDEDFFVCCSNTEIHIEKDDGSHLCVVLLYAVNICPGLIGFYGYSTTEYIPGLRTEEDAQELIKILQSGKLKHKETLQ